jgi:exopolysaccharide production protein ExoZ
MLTGPIRNIQALRFLAAFSVLFYHLSHRYPDAKGGAYLAPLFSIFDVTGFFGVDTFFVISGFIIWRITSNITDLNSSFFFLVRRLGRVYLGYWPWLVAQSVVILIIVPTDMLGAALRANHDVLKSIFLLPSDNLILGLSWTLVNEVMFYVIIGCSLALARGVALSVVLIWGTATLLANIYAFPAADLELFTPFVLEFCMGVLLAELYWRFGPLPLAYCLVSLLAPTILIFAISLRGYELDAGSLARVLTIGPLSVGLVASAIALENRGWRVGKALVGLGDASYSLYLCHVPLILVSKTYLVHVDISPDLKAGMVGLVIVLFSVGWFRLVERPVYRKFCRGLATLGRAPKITEPTMALSETQLRDTAPATTGRVRGP